MSLVSQPYLATIGTEYDYAFTRDGLRELGRLHRTRLIDQIERMGGIIYGKSNRRARNTVLKEVYQIVRHT